MGRIPGDEEVDSHLIKEPAVQCRTVRIDAATDGGCPGQYYHFGFRDCLVANAESFGHIFRDGSSNDQPVGMPWRGHKLDPVTAHVEIHIPASIQLHLCGIIPPGRDLTEPEGMPEKGADLSSDPGSIQAYRFIHLWGDDQSFPDIGGDPMVVGK